METLEEPVCTRRIKCQSRQLLYINTYQRSKWKVFTINNNERRLMTYCLVNDLAILNTVYQHKYTKEEPTRKEKFILHYVITNSINKNEVAIRVYRSYK